ncbi:MAG: phosphocholine cytidylyltransferase family protein [Verrucomicrobiales bacterium]|nr:phosphocholine cytidylyltransferase family protein [Verrucomicrobiales bacterium]
MKNVALTRELSRRALPSVGSPEIDSLNFPVEHATSFTPPRHTNEPRITTALLLAAGTGSRLQPLTKAAPKCLTEVNGVSILERLISNLREQGFKRLVVVTGHLGDQIQRFLSQYASDLQIDYVFNPDYATTNNLYSLWLARQQITESFLLVESDLIFDFALLDGMLKPDKMAISEMLPWMNGTTVELDSCNGVTAFRPGGYSSVSSQQYKTVNVYSLSYSSWKKVEERMSRHVLAGELGEYYEVVFAEMIADGTLSFDGVFFDSDLWYEIDTGIDLIEAENLFSQNYTSTGDRLTPGAECQTDSRTVLI